LFLAHWFLPIAVLYIFPKHEAESFRQAGI